MPPTMDPGPEPPVQPERERGFRRVRRAVLGGPKNLQDPHLFHSLSLAAFLAWVGLGADGLSSSAYGPEQAFKNLGEHQYLAVFLAALTALTVVVIAASYSKIIEHFPFGGGGYVVASRLLGPRAGMPDPRSRRAEVSALLRLVPRVLGDWVYDRVARNRYALFGRTEHCMLPPPRWRDRFIDS